MKDDIWRLIDFRRLIVVHQYTDITNISRQMQESCRRVDDTIFLRRRHYRRSRSSRASRGAVAWSHDDVSILFFPLIYEFDKRRYISRLHI